MCVPIDLLLGRGGEEGERRDVDSSEGGLVHGYGLGGNSRLVRGHLGRLRELRLPAFGLPGGATSIYSRVEHPAFAKDILSGTEKTGSSVVKGRHDPRILAFSQHRPPYLPEDKLHRMIPQATARHVRRTFADVGDDVASASVSLTRATMPWFCQSPPPVRPTECGLKCIGLPSLLPRDEVVIDSCGADGISL